MIKNGVLALCHVREEKPVSKVRMWTLIMHTGLVFYAYIFFLYIKYMRFLFIHVHTFLVDLLPDVSTDICKGMSSLVFFQIKATC